MPDWAVNLIIALVSAGGGAGGVVAYFKARQDARLALITRQDDYTLKLRDSLDKDEAEFRKTVYEAFRSEVARNREMDERLTETQKQLTIVTLERDDLKRKLERALSDLDQAHQKIRHMEDEIATLQHQQHSTSTE